ncbi:hypothetical protein [Amycolatopsis samaneae]|uniref:Uncharacterized protein n=1 Tax=Amycolatopsis samaneae TaxID=664691 RepID=A0ABW5GF31_9PSEU
MTAEIRVLLAAAALPATEAEIATLAARYPAFRAAVDALHEVPAARDLPPVLGLRVRTEVSGPGA